MTEDRGGGGGKEEPAVAIGGEGLRAAQGSQVRSGSKVTTDQGEARGTREHGGATWLRVSGKAEGGRSQSVTAGRRAEVERRD